MLFRGKCCQIPLASWQNSVARHGTIVGLGGSTLWLLVVWMVQVDMTWLEVAVHTVLLLLRSFICWFVQDFGYIGIDVWLDVGRHVCRLVYIVLSCCRLVHLCTYDRTYILMCLFSALVCLPIDIDINAYAWWSVCICNAWSYPLEHLLSYLQLCRSFIISSWRSGLVRAVDILVLFVCEITAVAMS